MNYNNRIVLLDCRFYGKSGIGRYIEGLLNSILEMKECEFRFYLLGDMTLLKKYNESKYIIEIVNYPYKPFTLSELFLGGLVINNIDNRISIFHFTHFNLPLFIPSHSIVTIHDLIPFHDDLRIFSKNYFFSILLKWQLRDVKMILTVSKYSGKQIRDYFKFTKTIFVMYPKLSRAFINIGFNHDYNNNIKFDQTKPYFLCVGNRKKHKNLVNTVIVCDEIFDEFNEYQLIIVGKADKKNDDITKIINKTRNKKNFKCIENADENNLIELYRNCFCLLFLSFEEGFGYPPFEAFSFGKPCIASSSSAISEVLQNGAFLVNPHDNLIIRSAIRQFIVDEDIYQEYSLKARQRFTDFVTKYQYTPVTNIYNEFFKEVRNDDVISE